MDKNIRLYPYYYAASSFLGWLPVFFLYFNEILSLKDVLLLEAVYYISVVILEIPTGYFSDLIGRRFTLLLGSLFLFAASIFYILGDNFHILAIGQIFFAFHMSLNSGTDTVFHYESLSALKRESEYGMREARSNKYGMLAGGTAALIGGMLASYEIKWAYYLTSVAALVACLIAYRFVEPKHEIEESADKNPFSQMKKSFEFLKQPTLSWIFMFYVALFAITHIPYEFYQPYLSLLEDRNLLFDSSTPILSGILYAAARYLGAYGAANSIKWKNHFGLVNYLLFNMLAMTLIVAAMGILLHPFIILIIAFRSLPWAASKAPINELVTPAISKGQRATYHSMMSLSCRLSFFICLFILSFMVPSGEASSWANLSLLLRISGVASLIFLVWIYYRVPKELKTS